MNNYKNNKKIENQYQNSESVNKKLGDISKEKSKNNFFNMNNVDLDYDDLKRVNDAVSEILKLDINNKKTNDDIER